MLCNELSNGLYSPLPSPGIACFSFCFCTFFWLECPRLPTFGVVFHGGPCLPFLRNLICGVPLLLRFVYLPPARALDSLSLCMDEFIYANKAKRALRLYGPTFN